MSKCPEVSEIEEKCFTLEIASLPLIFTQTNALTLTLIALSHDQYYCLEIAYKTI